MAHPGHELHLLEWMREARPTIYIMTAGARAGARRDRIEASRRLAAAMGATPGEVFGESLDRDIYEHILASDPRPFVALAETLAESFVRRAIELVVVDAWQMYNVSHDLWHLIVRAAAANAARATGHAITCLEFEVVPPSISGKALGPAAMRQSLSADRIDAKLALAADFPDLAQEISELLAAGGRAFIAQERLHEARPVRQLRPAAGETPRYEREGEARVAAGVYDTVLRWRHVAPIVEALEQMMDARVVA